MKLGLFGRPVGHSLSPKLFEILGLMLRRPIEYTAVEIKDGQLAAAIKEARNNGWRGVNITIPFKIEAHKLAVTLTPQAKTLGVVNVFKFGDSLTGHNTDAEGLMDALKFAGVIMSGKDALVFGAGGAARAAGWALAKGGVKSVHFVNRTASTATKCVRALAPLFPKTKFTSGKAKDAHIWINATPLGLKGYPDKSPAPKSLRAPETAVDLVYGRKTAFQRHAESLGSRVYDGTAMLVFQALRGWEFWDKPLGDRRVELAQTLIEELS